ncbi:MAG TPA: cyclic nucleotide-binding domain-containing protein [Kofleriaceae bacterium]|nr:cyclic nucleotide-binding domain-containing protein [Kofleriaceae bacterium]
MAEPATTEKKKPAKAKLPVVEGDKPAKAAGSDKPAKGGKAAKVKAGGWAAFTDAGSAPKHIVAARVVLVLALCATVPTLLGVRHGNRILWTIAIASLPLFWVVAGYHVWRRICPLAVAGQLGRLVGRPGTKKVEGWLAENYLFLQVGLMLVGLTLRLVATNGSAYWLSGFLITVVVAAAIVSFIYGGKTWCNFICPVGVVEKMYTEPARAAGGKNEMNSQCAPCVACKKHCPDIDLEQGYWKELPDRGRIVYFAWPGIVVAFYVYYWLYAGSWDYYFSGSWAYERTQPQTWLDDGFYFLGGIPRVVAAPLTLIAFGAASMAFFVVLEKLLWKHKFGKGKADGSTDAQDQTDARLLLRHRLLAVAGFTAFVAFYFFAGQPSLRRLPEWAVRGVGAVVIFAAAAIFFRRFHRQEAEYVQEKFAQKILKKWEWGDAPPSDDLKDIYLLHTERTKQRESRLRAYKETVRELVADGLVTRAELVILDSLRAQLGISDKDHQKVIGELSGEEKQLFDPAYQGSVEQRLKGQQYRKELERLVVEAARTGGAAASPGAVSALRGEYGISDDEHAAEMARILGDDGPVVGFVREEIAEIVKLGAAARATEAPELREAANQESATVSFVGHLTRWRGTEHAGRALGLLGAIANRPEIAEAREALATRPRASVAIVSALRGTAPDELLRALIAALEGLWSSQAAAFEPAPFLALCADASRYVRAAVAIVLSRFDDDASRGALVAAFDDTDAIVRQAAVRALGARSRLTRELLQKALADKEPMVRSTAVRAVSGGTSGEYPAAGDPEVMAQTVKGVGNAGVFATLDANARVETLTEIEKLVLLRQVPMFAELAPDQLEDLAEVVVERHFQPGSDLCREGDAGDAVFLLVKGKVKVFTGGGGDGRPERVLSELGPGACIGEMAVFDAAPRSATVRATERTRSLTLPGDDFKGLLNQRPEMSQVIIAELVRRMRGLMAK